MKCGWRRHLNLGVMHFLLNFQKKKFKFKYFFPVSGISIATTPSPEANPGFPRGAPTYYLTNFPQNYMEMKKFLPLGEGPSLCLLNPSLSLPSMQESPYFANENFRKGTLFRSTLKYISCHFNQIWSNKKSFLLFPSESCLYTYLTLQ